MLRLSGSPLTPMAPASGETNSSMAERTIIGAASRCSQNAQSARGVRRSRSEASKAMAAANTPRPHSRKTTVSANPVASGRRKLATPSAATVRLAASGSRANGSLKRQ